MNEIKVAGASYISSFFQEVTFLNHNFAVYINANLELANKCGNDKEKVKHVAQIELQNINNAIQLMRVSIIKTYLGYKTIGKNVKFQENKELENLYKKLTENYNFESVDLQSYIMEINNILVSDIIKELVENSQLLLQQIYSNDNTARAGQQ